jgi:hypothetical protein
MQLPCQYLPRELQIFLLRTLLETNNIKVVKQGNYIQYETINIQPQKVNIRVLIILKLYISSLLIKQHNRTLVNLMKLYKI